MTFGYLGADPLGLVVQSALQKLNLGESVENVETIHLDFKEEPGRRGKRGVVLEGRSENECAAEYLTGEMACMANTPGGGAIILGVADDGSLIGTALNKDWLRHRIWEISKRQLTVAVRAERIGGVRLLVLTVAEALEPVKYEGRLRWRVGGHCVEVDAITWWAGMLQRIGYDWSAQLSGHTFADVRPTALTVARRYVHEMKSSFSDDDTVRDVWPLVYPTSSELGSNAVDMLGGVDDLAYVSDEEFLRRLRVMDAQGRLTNAGSLLFVGTPHVGIDYMRRAASGADSAERFEGRGPLVEQVCEVERLARAANRVTHVVRGFVHTQVRAIPAGALREAVVNGVVHRDWMAPYPTTVEHVGDTLTVTSPGGFVGDVNPDNIITHPAVHRYRNLAEAVALMGLAERQGVGVDKMVKAMLVVGHLSPVISEIAGPYVRVVLMGGPPDRAVFDFVRSLTLPADTDSVLLIELLYRRGWVDGKKFCAYFAAFCGGGVASDSPFERDLY